MARLQHWFGACALCAFILQGGAELLAGEVLLLDFGADWCGPCRAMAPVVKQLAEEGHPVREVNIDQEAALAAQFGVDRVPTFVMTVDGREVDRRVGPCSKADLVGMIQKARAANDADSAAWQAAGDLALTSLQGGQIPFASAAGVNAPSRGPDRLLRASVRLQIEDNNGKSTGSGTIIDARDGEALILTCGHVFREYQDGNEILVDLFGEGAPKQLPGRLISYDLNSDVGLVRVSAQYPFVAAKVAPAGYKSRTNDPVTSVGCDHGADATIKGTSIVSVDRYSHAPNLQVAFMPVQGRSGGGLFNRDGFVIGVCNAADQEEQQGLFASAQAIQAELDRAKLSFVYRDGAAVEIASNGTATPPIALQTPTEHPSIAPPAGSLAELSLEERELLEEIRRAPHGADIYMFVHSLDEKQPRSRVIQLNRASPAFWQRLAEARTQAGNTRLTSLESPSKPTASREAAAATSQPFGKLQPVRQASAEPSNSDRVWPPRTR